MFMITNLIFFLYGIKVEYIRKNRDSYVFYYDNNFYIFKEVFFNEEYLSYIYNFIVNSDILFHSVIKNKNNKLISIYDNKRYVLMMVKFNMNRTLMLSDILDLGKYHFSYISKNRFNWIDLWKYKIDQVDGFINSNIDKISISTLSIINYYICFSEIAINCFNQKVLTDAIPLTLCHNRILYDSDLYEYYSVTNLVFDHYTRDVGEYIKNYVYSNKKIDFNVYKFIKKLSYNDRWMLLSRLLFPSYFFDVFDSFVLNDREFLDFDKYFINISLYEENLKNVIAYLIK